MAITQPRLSVFRFCRSESFEQSVKQTRRPRLVLGNKFLGSRIIGNEVSRGVVKGSVMSFEVAALNGSDYFFLAEPSFAGNGGIRGCKRGSIFRLDSSDRPGRMTHKTCES